MDRRELITGLGAALAGVGCAAGPRARDPLPDPVQANYVAELERDLARIKATRPSPELAATLEAEGFAPGALGRWLSAMALAMAFRSHSAALKDHPRFLDLVLRQAGEVAESLLTVATWLDGMSAKRRRALARAAGPDQTFAVLDQGFLRRGGLSSDRLGKLDDAFARTHRRWRRNDPDTAMSRLLDRVHLDVGGSPGGARIWRAAGPEEHDPAGGRMEVYPWLYGGAALATAGGLVGIGYGFCMGCVSNTGWNIGCYAGVGLLVVAAALLVGAVLTNILAAARPG